MTDSIVNNGLYIYRVPSLCSSQIQDSRMAPASAAYRPGAWKQSNKGHKTGGHRSKGMVEKENRGRVEGGSICGKKIKKAMGKAARRHQQAQLRRAAKEEMAVRKRAVGGPGAPPVLVHTLCSPPFHISCHPIRC